MPSDAAAPDGAPRQAVILAGGRGTRLLPLTADLPKPMLPFHGRPFLAFLLELLAGQGIRRVVLLLGYLPDAIRGHFGDGGALGLHIDYCVTDVDADTGTRLRAARDLLDAHFLLLYCDNYWPLRLDAMWAHLLHSGCEALVTAYANRDGYTRSNLELAADGRVVAYDRARRRPGLHAVDIGFMILRRDCLRELPDGDCSLEADLLPRLVARGALTAYTTEHRYYSVGSHERLPSTHEFLARRPAVFLDRDGVLNRRMPPARYVCSRDDWQWLPGALDALRALHLAGVRTFVVTNQPGIARGHLDAATLDGIHAAMCDDVLRAGGAITGIYHCPHGWDDGCDCRKPRPGLLFRAQREHLLDLSRVTFLGDDARDGEAADAAGCRFVRISDGYPLAAAVPPLLAALAAR